MTPSITQASYRRLLWGVALTGTLLDQVTKYSVFAWLRNDADPTEGSYQVIPGAFRLLAQYQEVGGRWVPKVNHGALFGLGGEYAALANAVFAGVSVLAAVAILVWSLRRSTARDVALCTSLGLILAGTVGNLYDRLLFGGVRDFLHFYWFEWPVFNVADCCLVCGAGLLLAQAFLSRAPSSHPTVEVARASQMVEAH
jgi:lipoprotein signal peptidase